jgi:molybdate transport system permease protein
VSRELGAPAGSPVSSGSAEPSVSSGPRVPSGPAEPSVSAGHPADVLPPRRGRSGSRVPVLLLVPALIGLIFLVLPVAGLLIRTPWAALPGRLAAPGVLDALRLSLFTATVATLLCVAFGVPLAWLLARTSFPGRRLVRALVTVPLVLPPVVGGVALLLVFGRRGLLGGWLDDTFGITLPFTTAGVVLAEAFVAMPFLVISVEGALRGADARFEEAAATLGAGRWTAFRRVTLPLVAPGIAAGAVLCWARALGEFGATITFAGNYPGRTQTIPLAVYLALETDLDAAIVLSLLLLAVSVAILASLRDRWITVP